MSQFRTSKTILLFLFAVAATSMTSAFTAVQPVSPTFTSSTTSTSLNAFFKGKDYDRVVKGIMSSKGLTREQAEKDYNAYLENPTNYALNKVCPLHKKFHETFLSQYLKLKLA